MTNKPDDTPIYLCPDVFNLYIKCLIPYLRYLDSLAKIKFGESNLSMVIYYTPHESIKFIYRNSIFPIDRAFIVNSGAFKLDKQNIFQLKESIWGRYFFRNQSDLETLYELFICE